MKKLFAILLSLAMVVTMIACGESSGGDEKVLNLSINMALSTIDPCANRAVQDLYVLEQVYEGLYFYDNLKGEFQPRVAESYTLSDDGLKYTFKINQKAKFHNGDAVKADDVIFSLNRAANSGSAASYLIGAKEFNKIDDATVEIVLENPSAPFLLNLSSVPIVCEKAVTAQGDKFGTEICDCGTGPYHFTYLDQDVTWTLEAFKDYYRGEANIKKIVYKPITDNSAAVMAMQSKELSYLQLSTVSGFDSFQADTANFGTEAVAANHITMLLINANITEGPLANKLVRQAIAYCLDKDAMNQAAYGGLGKVADYMENPTYNNCAPDGGIKYTYNPEKAKELLKEAGYENGVNVGKILSFTGSQFEKCAQIAQANMAAVGITAEVEWNEQATCIARWNADPYGDFEMTTSGWGGTYDYDGFRYRFYYTSGSSFYDWTKSQYDYMKWADMIDEAVQMTDKTARTALHQEINDLIMDEALFIPLLNKCIPCVWTADLNVVNRPSYYYVYEWSWKN